MNDEYNDISDDFPELTMLGSITRSQPDLDPDKSLIRYEGEFYAPGSSPPERYAAWQKCEKYAQQHAHGFIQSKAGKCAHLSEQRIVDLYLIKLFRSGRVTEGEAVWILEKAARLAGWNVTVSGTDEGSQTTDD